MLRQLGFAALAWASIGIAWPSHSSSQFQYFVIFGDSYTNDGFSSWFASHHNNPPPPGVLPPQTSQNSGGGLSWAQFVGNYTGASIYDYASGGAACSNKIVARVNSAISLDFASVLEDEVPKYESDTRTKLYKDVNAKNAVYGLWIGTNDLGVNAFLTDSQHTGADLNSYIDCIWTVFDHVYKAGGRRFVLLNNNALGMTPLYQIPSKGGAGNNGYWPNKESYNMTEYSQKISEYVATTNRMMDYGAPFNLIVKRRWPGASFTVFNVHDLIINIYNNPKQYLEAPYNVAGYYIDCPAAGCPPSRRLNGYLWYDALHPSNKTNSHIAKEFVRVVAGDSKYATYWH